MSVYIRIRPVPPLTRDFDWDAELLYSCQCYRRRLARAAINDKFPDSSTVVMGLENLPLLALGIAAVDTPFERARTPK